MQSLIVVQNPQRWDFNVPGATVVAARDYLRDVAYSSMRYARVYNLCRSYRYLSLGYYVSLLAEARGHRPLPSVNTVQDLRTQAVVRVLSDDLEAQIQRALAPLQSERFTLSVYFGQNMAKRYQRLSFLFFNLFPAPLLRVQFVREDRWQLQGVQTVSSSDIPDAHRAFVEQAAQEYLAVRARGPKKRAALPDDIAILVNPADDCPPSDERALKQFARAAEGLGMRPTFVTKDDYVRIAEYDALFIRDTTQVDHYTYRFASRAAAEGLVVMDDPRSIVRCTNKVYLAELLGRHGVPVPATHIVHGDDLEEAARRATYPCILKRPDSSFSQGVVKAVDEASFLREASAIFEQSDLVLVQEFVPTEFDWRVGIIDRTPLFVCRYFMAPKHWQIINWGARGSGHEGRFETLPVDEAPKGVVRTALRAANLIGDGLYGVDLKSLGRAVRVIEVNDNPSIDAGVEDKLLGPALYDRIMQVFRQRIDAKRRAGASA